MLDWQDFNDALVRLLGIIFRGHTEMMGVVLKTLGMLGGI